MNNMQDNINLEILKDKIISFKVFMQLPNCSLPYCWKNTTVEKCNLCLKCGGCMWRVHKCGLLKLALDQVLHSFCPQFHWGQKMQQGHDHINALATEAGVLSQVPHSALEFHWESRGRCNRGCRPHKCSC
ncbi:hypothetical protein AVEN_137839-1 [Araneus ventricosus]|uniref:Uncharacterized protein n=1 Tax=Araneus ventricosus TaxID=182803 RepID=A0A4Y2QTR4_ARAVE|nr:hypothetical protein AVEN_137839-1 [Araneus ventricosus]